MFYEKKKHLCINIAVSSTRIRIEIDNNLEFLKFSFYEKI